MQKVDREVPADLEVHLVLDNSPTHKTPTMGADLTPTAIVVVLAVVKAASSA